MRPLLDGAPGPAVAGGTALGGAAPVGVDVEPRRRRNSATASRLIRDAIAAGDVYQVNLCRVLSAPLGPSADVAALGAALAEGNPAPVLGRGAGAGRPGGVGVARALPPARRRHGRVPPHQGHGRDRRRLPGQGPGRERDDRRPGAQRPGPGVRVRLGRRARVVRGGATPGLHHLVSTVRAGCDRAWAGPS